MNIAIIGAEKLYRTEINAVLKHIEDEDAINHTHISPKDINSFAAKDSKNELCDLLKSCQLCYVVAGSGKRAVTNQIDQITHLYILVLKGWGVPIWVSHSVEFLEDYEFPIVGPKELKGSLSDFKSTLG